MKLLYVLNGIPYKSLVSCEDFFLEKPEPWNIVNFGHLGFDNSFLEGLSWCLRVQFCPCMWSPWVIFLKKLYLFNCNTPELQLLWRGEK